MTEDSLKQMSLVSLTRRLDRSFWPRESGRIYRMLEESESILDVNLQITDHPDMEKTIFGDYAPRIKEEKERILELYAEFERREREYQAGKSKR